MAGTFIILWLLLCLAVGWSAGKTKLGSTNAFLISLILSPLIGFIVVLFFSEKKKEIPPVANTASSIADELLKLQNLKANSHITEEEYQAAKKKLIA